MRVGQSRFELKSTGEEPTNNLDALLESLEGCQGLSQPQQNYLSRRRINSFILALLKVQKTILNQSIVKNVNCRPASSQAIKYLSQLDGAQVKDCIAKNVFNCIEKLTSRLEQLKESITGSFINIKVQKYFNVQEIERLTNLCLCQLLENMKIDLKTGFRNKQIYALINFTWTTEFTSNFIATFNQQSLDVAQLQKQIENIKGQLDSSLKKNQIINKVKLNKVVVEYEPMSTEQILMQSSSKNIAQLNQKQFQNLKGQLVNKEKECMILQTRVDECEQIITKQMSMIGKQQKQKQKLKESLSLSQSEFHNLTNKCEIIENQLQQMNRQIQNVKKNSQATKPAYYINPLWQKQQLEQKYFVQIIQLQSDLLIQKQQVQSLVNIVLQEIKLSHELFKDLSASKYMTHRFDNQVLKLLRTTSAFDKINLQEHLIVRQEGLESESSPQMHKSSISTFSELDTQFKMRSEKELWNFQNTQQESKQQL